MHGAERKNKKRAKSSNPFWKGKKYGKNYKKYSKKNCKKYDKNKCG